MTSRSSFLDLYANGLKDISSEHQDLSEMENLSLESDTDESDPEDDMKLDEKSYETTDDEQPMDDDDEEPLSDQDNKSVPLHTTFWSMAMGDLLRYNDNLRHEEVEKEQIEERGEEYFSFAAGKKRFKAERGDSKNSDNIHKASYECEGDRRVKKLRELFTQGFKTRVRPGDDPEAFKRIVPSSDQLNFLNWCMFSCLPHIYGTEEWPTHCARVLKEWGLGDEVRYFIMMVTARRVGKTYAVGMFDSGMISVVPGMTIAVYSTGRRASEMLKDLVEQFVCMTGEENAQRIVVSNQEKLFISHNLSRTNTEARTKKGRHSASKDPTTAQLSSFPTSRKGVGKKQNKTKQTTGGGWRDGVFGVCL